jgi:hypothetical protein
VRPRDDRRLLALLLGDGRGHAGALLGVVHREVAAGQRVGRLVGGLGRRAGVALDRRIRGMLLAALSHDGIAGVGAGVGAGAPLGSGLRNRPDVP